MPKKKRNELIKNKKQRIEGRKKPIKRKNAKRRRRRWFESNKVFTF
jgi:hypothetical protein